MGLGSHISFATPSQNKDIPLQEKAKIALLNGDTTEACAIFRRLKIETDSIAKINYQNEIEVKRATYQTAELNLENKLQKGIILRRISLFLCLIILLLGAAFYFLRKTNHKLEQERIKAKQLKDEAILSLQKKSELLYTISNDMTKSLNEMKAITTNLQTVNTKSLQEVNDNVSSLRSTTEKLQKIYRQIFSK
ncbi:MAG: hypothetical protein RSC04_00995 [Bacteroidales bacterium]